MISHEQIMEALQFRHAAKDFDPNKKINSKDWETIVQAGHLAPTSLGLQAYKMVVVQDPALRKELAVGSLGGIKQIPNASHLVIFASKKGQHLVDHVQHVGKTMFAAVDPEIREAREHYVQQTIEAKKKTPRGEEELTHWSSKQVYIVAGFMMLAAAELGIDSCPIEGINKEGMQHALHQHANLSPSVYDVSLAVAFGTRILPQQERYRFDLKDVVISL